MKKIILIIALSFFYSVSFAQVEGVEVEKPKEEEPVVIEGDKESEDDEEEEKMRFIDRLFFGGNFGASFGNQTFIDVSPMVGYRITPRFSAGVGITYQYQRINDRFGNLLGKQSIYGGRVFSRYNIANDFLGVGNLFAHTEYETLFAKYSINNFNGTAEGTELFPAFFIGGGFAFPIGNRSAFTISALYNPFYDEFNSLYTSPLQIRIGGFF
ncbi:hypothetical protein WAF17_04735 [Bernardetia sp. ABR2-2B]|uniref:hypothetical protein n=1 Tax=Bernardetia sp. ABR2-2B TaxID=3127472 RepID=UPI0030CA64C4